MNSVLIVLHGSIGDVIRALPLAVRLKRNLPSVKVTWAVEPKSQGVLEKHPAIDRVVVFQRTGGLSAYRRFIAELRADKYDLVLDLQRHFKSGLTSFLSGGTRRIGFNRADAKEFNWLFNNEKIPAQPKELPKIRHYQCFGDLLGFSPVEPLDFGFRFSEDERSHAESLIRRAAEVEGVALPEFNSRIAIIVGSSWPSKNWPIERYRELVVKLYRDYRMIPILLGGSGEAVSGELIRDNKYPLLNLIGRTSLRESAALLTRVFCAVGSDSGPSHLAAAVGCPVITLWGPTSAQRNVPYGNDDRILSSAIGCSPCMRRKCPGLDNLCLSDIPAEAILAKITQLREQK